MRTFAIWMVMLLTLMTACSPHIHLDLLGRRQDLAEVAMDRTKEQDKILLVNLSGPIQTERDPSILASAEGSVAGIFSRLERAAADPGIRGIILKIDTPGGEGTASDIIYHEIMRYRERTGRPIVALMMGLATSGGYYVAAACDYIIAHPTTLTGSIGVIGILPNIKGILQRVGIKINVFKSGKMKDAGSPYRDMTDEEKQSFQRQIDAFHEKFVQVVYGNRKQHLTLDEVKKLADGRVYNATEALGLKLIDEIGYYEAALKKVLALAKISKARVVSYTRHSGAQKNIYSVRDGSDPMLAFNIDLLGRLFPRFQAGIYYLWLPDSLGSDR